MDVDVLEVGFLNFEDEDRDCIEDAARVLPLIDERVFCKDTGCVAAWRALAILTEVSLRKVCVWEYGSLGWDDGKVFVRPPSSLAVPFTEGRVFDVGALEKVDGIS